MNRYGSKFVLLHLKKNDLSFLLAIFGKSSARSGAPLSMNMKWTYRNFSIFLLRTDEAEVQDPDFWWFLRFLGWFDMGVSINGGTPNGWFIMDHPIKKDDLGVPLFYETYILRAVPFHFGCSTHPKLIFRPFLRRLQRNSQFDTAKSSLWRARENGKGTRENNRPES
jgi:hypothetical protein